MPHLHLDTDLGGDIDDLCALALLLNWPGADLRAVSTVAEHNGKRAGYVKHTLALVGRTDVPVNAGADASSNSYRYWPGLPDESRYWPHPVAPAPGEIEDALNLLERTIEEGAIIVAIGPFTNLALLEKRCPGILRRATLFLMGGYIYSPRNGFPAWSYEMDYNTQADAESALYVFERSTPTMVPIAVTAETALRERDLPTLRHSGPLAALIAHQAEAFAQDERMEQLYGRTCTAVPGDIINFLHDPLACAIALGWREGVEIKEMNVQSAIENSWLRQRPAKSGRPMKVVTRVNGSAFSDFWLQAVTRSQSQ